ncbi:MAG: lysophospholipid acyltransferase family protein [Veillonella sp.]|nr:lysophospholipid acyltransferase family protein [Veillonella sp.]
MNKFSTWLWRTAFWLRYKVGYGLKVYGRDNFPMEGPVIVVPNHLSNNDPPICGYALPRHVHFMAKQELFVNPISRFFCTWLGAFPLNRGAIDKVAIRHAMGLLKDNKVLGIFAEGNRQKSGKLGKFHDGAASIALRTAVSIPVEKAKATPEAIQKVNDSVKSEIQRMIDSYHNNCIEETLWK